MLKALQMDFQNYNGHQMILSGRDAFQKKHLDELELHMLTANRILNLLPVTWVEQDREYIFHYQIEGYRLISHYLRMKKLTMLRYYSLLLSIADGLAHCYEYMLRPECCLLDEQALYIDEGKEQIALAYLPLQKPLAETSEVGLLLITIKWAESVQHLDASGYHRLLRMLTGEGFHIHKFRQLLLDLIHEWTHIKEDLNIHSLHMNNEDNILNEIDLNNKRNDNRFKLAEQNKQHQNISAFKSAEKVMIRDASPHAFDFSAEKSEGKLRLTNMPKNNNDGFANIIEIEREIIKEKVKQESKSDSKSDSKEGKVQQFDEKQASLIENHINHEHREDWLEGDQARTRLNWKHIATTISIVAIIVICWLKLYVPDRKTEMLFICIGLTVGLLALIALIIYNPLLTLFESDDQNEDEEFQLLTDHAEKASARLSNQIHHSELTTSKRNLEKLNDNIIDTLHNKLDTNKSSATVKLDEKLATQLLDENPRIIRTLYGEKKTIALDELFIIGRAEEGVHYKEDAVGVSRIHIEFECRNGLVQVKDVGSRNGTYLNGKLMVAYKAYSLNTGDQLQLASKEGPIYERVS